MVFSSLIFLYAFFPLSLLGCVLCRTKRQRNTVLLISFSCFSSADRSIIIPRGVAFVNNEKFE